MGKREDLSVGAVGATDKMVVGLVVADENIFVSVVGAGRRDIDGCGG